MMKFGRIDRNHCGITLTDDFGKYLGAPMIHGRVTKKTYGDILSENLW